VNLEKFSGFEAESKIDPKAMKEAGLIKNLRGEVKVLGGGELKVAVHVRAHKFSKSAVEKIEKAGGSVEIIEPTQP